MRLHCLLLLLICVIIAPAGHAAFRMHPSFFERAMHDRPTPQLSSPLSQKPLQQDQMNMTKPVDGPRVQVIVSPERKRQTATRFILIGTALVLAGAALAAYGFNYDETHHGEKGTGMPMIALGLWTSLAGLLGFIGTGIYLHIRY